MSDLRPALNQIEFALDVLIKERDNLKAELIKTHQELAQAVMNRDALELRWKTQCSLTASAQAELEAVRANKGAKLGAPAGWLWVATCGSGTEQVRKDEPVRGYSHKEQLYKAAAPQAPTPPAAMVPLTKNEISDLWDRQIFYITDLMSAEQFVRDVEAAHGIGTQGAQEGTS